MGKRTRRNSSTIKNLGIYAQKKQKRILEANLAKEKDGNKENVPVRNAEHAIEHMHSTFEDITKRTWGGVDPLVDQPLNERPPPEPVTEYTTNPRSEVDIAFSDTSSSCSETVTQPTRSPFTPPSMADAQAALKDITAILHPHTKSAKHAVPYADDTRLIERMEMMKMLLHLFTDATKQQTWISASLTVAHAFENSVKVAEKLRKWTRSFIEDRDNLPASLYGTWNTSLLQGAELAHDLNLYLQGVGDKVKAADIVEYTSQPEVQETHGLKRAISLSTAMRWLHILNYRWTEEPDGQYVDGHEREDVVEYCQKVFLPTMAELQSRMRIWNAGIEEMQSNKAQDKRRHVVVWYHDETTFYANNRRKLYWIRNGTDPVPKPKGPGPSYMIANFASTDYGFLQSPDGKENAQICLRAGKDKDGYLRGVDICAQNARARGILTKYYPHDEHIFIYDNARTHQKRPDNALSARKMPKKPAEDRFWGCTRNVTDTDGNLVYREDGKPKTEKIPMMDGWYGPDRTPQPLYNENGHFKGMLRILEERGWTGIRHLKAECKKFKCVDPAARCCLRRILYNEPDFSEPESCLETECKAAGFRVLFLPKFHPELNPIEQCWGYAKRVYRNYSRSSSEAALEKNVKSALAAIPLESIRRFCNRSLKFMDAYRKGLNGKEAAYAARKYKGHQCCPDSVLDDIEKHFGPRKDQ